MRSLISRQVAKVGLIEAGAAGEHARVDAGAIHHPHMRGEIGEQRIEQVIGIAVLVELHRNASRSPLKSSGGV